MYARTVRSLTEREKQRLGAILAGRSPLSLRSPGLWVASVGLSAVLWGLTVLASKLVLWPMVLWASVGILVPIWIGWDEGREHRARRRGIESALATNRVQELRVATTESVALDEIEDCGEAWAFQVDPDRILLLGGTDLPEGFPTTDFSYLECLGAAGQPVDFWFELRGEPLAPMRRIAAEARRDLDLERSEVVAGRLDQLEELLRRAG